MRGDFPLNILVREGNWGVVDLSLLTVGIEVIFEHFIEYHLLLVKSVWLNNTRMLKGGQDVDPNKTANDIFKMKYGVPIQGANFDTKWIVTASGNSPAALSQKEWPDLSSVTSANNNKQEKKQNCIRDRSRARESSKKENERGSE